MGTLPSTLLERRAGQLRAEVAETRHFSADCGIDEGVCRSTEAWQERTIDGRVDRLEVR